MNKKTFVVEIPKELDVKFREEVRKQGKQYNLSMEEAIKLWLEENKKNNRE